MNDLDKIKEILFGNEKKALNALVRRLETPESRTADVADVLPDAVTRSYHQDPRLHQALSDPMEATLSEAIRREPKKFADALFPVMGPAIRKSISEALKSMLQSMNNAIDTSLSPTARFKAWRAGVPLAEWVLRNNLVYRVDQVYLINPRSGLLVEHLHHPDVDHKDEDAVSAMLTAIQDFIHDSFVPDSPEGLDSAVIGEFTVWVSQGPHAMLACVIRGVPPAQLKTDIRAVNERIHLHHSRALLEFTGDAGAIPNLDAELGELLLLERRASAQAEKRSLLSPPLVVALVALLALTGFLLGRAWLTEARLDEFNTLIKQSAGIITTSSHRDGGSIHVTGLRDPLAPDPLTLAKSVGIKPEQLELEFHAYQSLEPEIVAQRVRRILEIPAGVDMQMRDDTLVVSGSATTAWREKLELLAPAIGGVGGLDVSGLQADDQSLELELREALAPDVNTQISVTKGVAIFSGVAPLAWHAKLNVVRELVPGVVDINKSNLQVAEIVESGRLRAQIDGQAFFYSNNAVPVPGQEVKLVKLAAQLRDYGQLMQQLNQRMTLQVVGFADGTGASELNTVTRARRANDLRQRLIQLGIEPSWINVAAATESAEDESNALMRKAEIRLPVVQL